MNEWNRSNVAWLVAIKGIIMMVSSDLTIISNQELVLNLLGYRDLSGEILDKEKKRKREWKNSSNSQFEKY